MTAKGPLKPSLYALELERTIGAAAESRAVLDVAAEAGRIAALSGFSPVAVATDLVEAGLEARINMEIPALQQLKRVQAARRTPASRRLH
jgi:uncharacterized metal-binding protein